MNESYEVKVIGTKPLLMHNPEGQIGDKPKLRRGEHLDPKSEAEISLYRDGDGNICVPSRMLKACLRSAGRGYKVSGRKSTFGSMILAGLTIEPDLVPLTFNQSWQVDLRPVVVQRQRILRARPRFDHWELEFRIINDDPTVIHADTLQKILEDAGKYYGLGDFRPEFGLFTITGFRT